MTGNVKLGILGCGRNEMLVELVLPGIFTIVLLSCLAHLGYCALQSYLEPVQSSHYAISAFAI